MPRSWQIQPGEGNTRKTAFVLVSLVCVLALSIGLLRSNRSAIRQRAPYPMPARIAVLPLGTPSQTTLRLVETALKSTFNVDVTELNGAPLPKSAYYEPRTRYRAEKLIEFAEKSTGWKIIGVTDNDISTTAHGAPDYGIMGLANINGRACVVSSFRAHGGIGAVAIHEIGHTLGLPHCPNPDCVMIDAKGSGRVAKSTSRFCPSCSDKIRHWLR